MTESDQELTGTYNDGSSDLVIGGRSDLYSDWFFDGTIYWVRVYDELHAIDEMKEIVKNSRTTEEMTAPTENPVVEKLFSVYPNPTQTELTINSQHSFLGKTKIEIYSETGMLVFCSPDEVIFPCQVDVSSFNAGVYLVKVSDDENYEIIKIIKN
jgi:hypothetical protein